MRAIPSTTGRRLHAKHAADSRAVIGNDQHVVLDGGDHAMHRIEPAMNAIAFRRGRLQCLSERAHLGAQGADIAAAVLQFFQINQEMIKKLKKIYMSI